MLTMSMLNHVHILLWAPSAYRFHWHTNPLLEWEHSSHTRVHLGVPTFAPTKRSVVPHGNVKNLRPCSHQLLRCTIFPRVFDLYVTTFHDLHTVISSSGFRLLCTPCQTPDNHDPPPKDGNLAYTNHQHQHWTFQQSPPLKTGRHLTIVWGYITQDE